MLVYSTGYPLLALALWTGAHKEDWTSATAFVALAVLMTFIGWTFLCPADKQHDDADVRRERELEPASSRVYVALYNRAGAIVILLGSYAVAARTQGWPTPETFVGWFALVWVPLFVSFAIPVESSSPPSDSEE